MPEITIQQVTYERLQKHAQPFVDSPDSVIARALDALDQIAASRAVPATTRLDASGTARLVDPRALPTLTHTKVLEAAINGQRITKPNWNLLVEELLCRTVKSVSSLDLARQICPVNMVKGRKTDEGYRYLPGIDVSIQGQDANSACRAIVIAARALDIVVDIEFMWRVKEDAQHPGETARILINGSKNKQSEKINPSVADTRIPRL